MLIKRAQHHAGYKEVTEGIHSASKPQQVQNWSVSGFTQRINQIKQISGGENFTRWLFGAKGWKECEGCDECKGCEAVQRIGLKFWTKNQKTNH